MRRALNLSNKFKKGEVISLKKEIECIPKGTYRIKEVDSKWLVFQIEDNILFGVRQSVLEQGIVVPLKSNAINLTLSEEFIRHHNALLINWLPKKERQAYSDTFCHIA